MRSPILNLPSLVDSDPILATVPAGSWDPVRGHVSPNSPSATIISVSDPSSRGQPRSLGWELARGRTAVASTSSLQEDLPRAYFGYGDGADHILAGREVREWFPFIGYVEPSLPSLLQDLRSTHSFGNCENHCCCESMG